MGNEQFTHEIEIAVEASRLHAFLGDLHNYRALHPLIQSVEDLPPDPALPRARRYQILDRVPWGPFRLRASYIAAIETISESEIRGYAWQKPGIHLRTIYRLTETSSGTGLSEHVSVQAPLLLRRFVTSQASRSHQATLLALKQELESTGST